MLQMEALDGSHHLEVVSAPDFSQFVKNVELNFQRSQAIRRQQFLLRQKNKENWLTKSKIIPPSLAKLQQHTTPNEPENRILHLASFYDYRKTTPFSESEAELQSPSKEQTRKQILQKQSRGACKTSHTILRAGNSCERLKQNWKLQFRRDELNVLQYTREEGLCCDDLGSQKQFRLRRVQKKFEEMKAPAKYEMYKTNIERLRGVRTVSPKARYRAINTRQ